MSDLAPTPGPLALEEQYGANNYAPLPVVAAEAEGCWIKDIHGLRYFDALAGYSALNFGHCNPRLIAAAQRQLHRVTLTSRAFHHDQLGPFCAELAALCGKEAVLPMNSGAEAVESSLKLARRWGYERKGVAEDSATIIVAENNFHGRTISIVSFSSDEVARAHYGPYTPGFRAVPYGDAAAIEAAMDDSVVAVLIEPIQGEAGVVIPPAGYLQDVRRICTKNGVLMMADEVQTGLGRTGRTFAVEHDDVVPDVFVLGKAIGGGVVPLSAVACDRDVMDVLTPGSHGSTFGGNPLATAVGREVIAILQEGTYQERAQRAEPLLRKHLDQIAAFGVTGVRVRGMWAGVDVDPQVATGKQVCLAARKYGVLIKETHESTIRLSPPLVASDEELELMVNGVGRALQDLREGRSE